MMSRGHPRSTAPITYCRDVKTLTGFPISRAIASPAVFPTLSVTPGRNPTSISQSKPCASPPVDAGDLDHGIGKRAAGGLFQLLRAQGGVDRVHLDRLYGIDVDAEVLDDPTLDLFAEGVPDPLPESDLDTIGHISP